MSGGYSGVGREGGIGSALRVGTVKQYAKSSITILLTALCALPVPAMPAGSASTRARARRCVNRYPGGRTFADSTSTDDSTYDDPILRAAALAANWRYNGAVAAVESV